MRERGGVRRAGDVFYFLENTTQKSVHGIFRGVLTVMLDQ